MTRHRRTRWTWRWCWPGVRPVVLAAGLILAPWPSPVLAQGLADLYAAALRSNPNLNARTFDVERARAESDGVRSRLLPQVTAQVTLSRNAYRDTINGDQRYGGRRASLNLRQSLYEPALDRRVEAAQATIAQREYELAQTRLALFEELLNRYLQALAAQDELAWLAAETEAAAGQVERMRVMRERQMVKVTELTEAQAYAQGLVTRTIDARNAHSLALAHLAELCGMPVARLPALTRRAFEPVASAQQAAVDQARDGHPRLQALRQAVLAASRNVAASRAEHLPQLAATLSRSYSDQGYDNRQQPPYHATSLGLELRVPLYEGGRVDAALREALARQGSAEELMEAARREVERETLTRWWNAQANHARIGSTAGEVQALEQTVLAQETGLKLGVSRITDVLDARRRLLKARADESKARYDFVRDVVALRVAGGDLQDADIAQWNAWFEPGGR